MTDTIAALARLLRQSAKHEPLAPAPEGDLEKYRELLENFDDAASVPGALRGAEFRPVFLVNGLILASRHQAEGRAFTFEALATGLETFPEYLAAITAPDVMLDDAALEPLRVEQKRFFAWLVAQFPECGMDLKGILVSMKGDALDQGTAYALRHVLEEGPDALLASDLFTDAEKALLKGVFAGEFDGWEKLQANLVATYRLPFRAAPRRHDA